MTSDLETKAGPYVNGPTLVRQYSPTEHSRDDAALARLGKKAVLKRNFGFLTIMGFSCTVLVTWEGCLIGGPSGLVYGFLVVWFGTFSVFVVISELVSMAPTSGGQYHWVSMLAPPYWRQFFGYMTGWLTIAGWQAAVASGMLMNGTMIQGLVLLTRPEYADHMQNWHGTLISWAVVMCAFAVNAVIGSVLAKFEGFVLIIHLLGFFAILLPLILLGEHTSAAEVFDTFLNSGNWPTQGLSLSIGITGVVFAFLGGDAAIHMSEEIENAPVVVPRSLLSGLMLNGCLGFGMVVTALFCMGDIDAALAENPVYPYMAIFHRAVGSSSGAAAMASIILVMSFSGMTGAVASTSRVYWAFARDRGLPGWRVLKRVNRRTHIPFNSVLLTTCVAILLSLINIGNQTAFNAVMSISIAALFGSYFFASSLLLYNRLTGKIQEPLNDGSLTNTIGETITWGPWRLRGLLGVANNTFACIYLIYVFFFSFWPPIAQVTLENFNWAVVVFTATISFSLLYYAIWARRTYLGPIIEL
ncbi:amino acid transporter [Apiospora kogelbergensis]|uniref:Amino acid transporter n=1 Tax=Apiospora kogelbergensis TaxID=1337665 RepID=A0AAW0QRG2_9PEZI